MASEDFVRVRAQRGLYELNHAMGWLVRRDFGDDVYVCGGFVRWAASPLANPVPPGDIDLYCRNEETYNRLKWHLIRTLKRNKKLRENAVSITFKQQTRANRPWFGLPAVQLIKPVDDGNLKTNGNLENVLSNFDFSIIRIGESAINLYHGNKFLADVDYLEDEKNKRIRIKNIHCPIASTYRLIKYCKKGYWVTIGEVLKIFLDWDGRDDDYRENLISFFEKVAGTDKEPSADEIDHIERLLRID